MARLLADTGIVRNRSKIAAAIGNAQATLSLYEGGTTLVDHLWSFTGGNVSGRNAWTSMGTIPPETDESRAMSVDLPQARLPVRGARRSATR